MLVHVIIAIVLIIIASVSIYGIMKNKMFNLELKSSGENIQYLEKIMDYSERLMRYMNLAKNYCNRVDLIRHKISDRAENILKDDKNWNSLRIEEMKFMRDIEKEIENLLYDHLNDKLYEDPENNEKHKVMFEPVVDEIKLVAYDGHNLGYAYIKHNDYFYIIKPPYEKNTKDIIKCLESDVTTSIAEMDYKACDKRFSNFSEVIEYLRKLDTDGKETDKS